MTRLVRWTPNPNRVNPDPRLPKYAPELNDIEVVWHDLKANHLAHQTFTNVNALDQAIHAAVNDLNQERMVAPLVKSRISA